MTDVLPMFPLGTVLLPHMGLPLHIFEPRYRVLVDRLLEGQGELGVVLIRRGPEVGGGDQRHEVGTRARVLQAEELDDGRWVVLLGGLRRLRVERWLPDDPHPWAEVTDLLDRHDDGLVTELHGRLAPRLRAVIDLQRRAAEEPAANVELRDDPAIACWQDPAASPLTPLDHQRLLEVDDCAQRLELLEDLLQGVEEVLTFRLEGPR